MPLCTVSKQWQAKRWNLKPSRFFLFALPITKFLDSAAGWDAQLGLDFRRYVSIVEGQIPQDQADSATEIPRARPSCSLRVPAGTHSALEPGL